MTGAKRKRPAGGHQRGAKGEHYGGSTRQQFSTVSPADALLPRLDRARETGPGRWLARCPAHNDGRPSLTVRETGDGTLLVHCWAGCPASDVVAAAGLSFADLFPDAVPDRGPLRGGQRWVPGDVLRAVAREVTIAAVAASDLAHGRPLGPRDRDRVRLAASRLHAAAQEVGHGR